MELFQYAMAIIKTFTQYSIWLHHWKVDSYPEQFLFLSRNTRHGHMCTALPGREVRARPNRRPQEWGKGCKPALYTASQCARCSGHARPGFVSRRKTCSNTTTTYITRPNTAFLQAHSLQHMQDNGPRVPESTMFRGTQFILMRATDWELLLSMTSLVDFSNHFLSSPFNDQGSHTYWRETDIRQKVTMQRESQIRPLNKNFTERMLPDTEKRAIDFHQELQSSMELVG